MKGGKDVAIDNYAQGREYTDLVFKKHYALTNEKKENSPMNAYIITVFNKESKEVLVDKATVIASSSDKAETAVMLKYANEMQDVDVEEVVVAVTTMHQ